MQTAKDWTTGHFNGQPAISSPRGLVATFEAGSQQAREQDAAAFRALLADLDRVTAERDALAEALRETRQPLILLGNYIGNEYAGGGGIPAFDRRAIIGRCAAALADADPNICRHCGRDNTGYPGPCTSDDCPSAETK